MKFSTLLLTFATGLSASTAAADQQSATALASALSTCGYQSPNTVPDHWVAVGVMGSESQNCFTYVPPTYQASYFGQGGNIFAESEYLNAHVLNGVPSGIQSCTAQGYAQWFVGFLTVMRSCTNITVDWFKEEAVQIGGQSLPIANMIYSCNRNGTQEIGGIRSVVSPSSVGLCTASAAGYFLPTQAISNKTCELSQITQAVKCVPTNGNGKVCHKPICSTQCRQSGYVNGGHCNSFEDCVCNSN